jgi:hypothetical protein
MRTYPDPKAERVTLTCVTSLRGGGVVGDPVREVRRYFTDEGECVAEYDPIARDPVILREWFRGRGWSIDMGDQASDDAFVEIVAR